MTEEGCSRAAEVKAMFTRYGPRYRGLAVVTVMLGAISAAMQATIVNVALPDIIRTFLIGHDSIQLMSTGFLSASTVAMLVSYWAIKRFGVRRVYLVALASFVVLSVAAAFSQDFSVLVVCRVGQGFIAGLLQPLAMIVILDVYHSSERGRAMAAYGLGIILSPAAGPVIGGVLVDSFGWRAVLLVTVPFCLIAFVMGGKYLVSGRAVAGAFPRLDFVGVALLSSVLVLLIGGLSSLFLNPGAAMWSILAGLVLALAFIFWQRRVRFPLLDLRVFRYRGFFSAILVSMAYGMGIHGSTYLIPLFAQSVSGFSAMKAGLVLLPGGLVLALVLLVSGRMADKYPPARVAQLGLIFFALSALMIGWSPGGAGFWLLAGWVVLGRVGLGFIIPGLSAASLNLLPRGNELAVTSVVSFARQLGGALGVAVLAVYLEFRQRSELSGESYEGLGGPWYAESFILIALVYAVALIPANIVASTSRRK